jgi:endoglucanase
MARSLTRRDVLRRGVTAAGTLAGASSLMTLLDGCVSPFFRATGPIQGYGGTLVDANGNEVRLTGMNWFGMETSTFCPHGLQYRSWQSMLDQMVSSGFNSLRLPYCNTLFDAGSTPNTIDFTKNPDLQGLSGQQIMDTIIGGAANRHMVVVLDRHDPTANTPSGLWYTPAVPESRWISDWTMLATRYKNQRAVIGADLHNEPHNPATWGTGNQQTDWNLAAERCGNAILAANPNWLIIVEGVEQVGNEYYWAGGNLLGARANPIRLNRGDRLVYSAHDYGPSQYQQSWFQASAGFPNNLPSIWTRFWGELKADGFAPMLVGEFGGRSVGTDPEGVWQTHLVDYLKSNGLSYTYWTWTPDSGDTGGLLNNDWTTVIQAKLNLLRTYQWPTMSKVLSG